MLDKYPLRAKKASDYAIWREAAHAWAKVQRRCTKHDWSYMAALKRHLEASRQFDAAPMLAPVAPPVGLTLWDEGD